MKQHEKRLQNAILMSVGRRSDTRLWRHNVGRARPLSNPDTVMQYGRPGQSDLMGIGPGGTFIAIECKAGGRLTPEQASWSRMVRAMGGLFILAKVGHVEEAGLEQAIEEAVGRVHTRIDHITR